jgi:putative aminopeptidase FrvX
MKTPLICEFAARLMRHPTVPYHEHAVRAEAEQICTEYGLPFERDAFGNVIARLCTTPHLRPLALAAHLDHPGFEVVRPLPDRRFLVRFRGGVADAYFQPGLPLRLMPGAVRAKLGRRKGKAADKLFEVALSTASKTPSASVLRPSSLVPRFAVWEMTDFTVRRDQIHGRACDDLVGVASALATLVELKRSRAQVNVLAVMSRAEEVGLNGALALAATHGVPANSLVISLETSRQLPGAQMGRGVILRMGDKVSVFNAEASRYLGAIASELQAKRPSFKFQRALMTGGTCEATAYQEFGLQSAAVCVALGNYHNGGSQARIKAEYVSVSDVYRMVELLTAAAKGMSRYPKLVGKLPNTLRHRFRAARPQLLRTAQDPA